MALSMNKRIRDKWADALESGKYKQAVGALRDDSGGYCCLGVLCEIAVEEGAIPAGVIAEGGSKWSFDGAQNMLPDSVIDWANLVWEGEGEPGQTLATREEFEGRGLLGGNESLVSMNDGRRYDFPQIAGVIRSQIGVR